MSERATYQVAIDADGDELFSGAGEDVTAAVVAPSGSSLLLATSRGLDAERVLLPSKAGEARVLLKNASGAYSALSAGRALRVRATYGGVTRDLFRGLLDRPQQLPRWPYPSVGLKALGMLSRLAGKQVSTALYANITTDVALGYLLDAAGWPVNLEPYLLSLAPTAYWPLDEPSGLALDESGNGNNGTVTLGAGTRAAAAIEDGGTGSLDYDGLATLVTVGTPAVLDNIWDGGGTAFALLRPDSAGESAGGRIFNKVDWRLLMADPSGSTMRVEFFVEFSGANGRWQTDRIFTAGHKYAVGVNYNSGATTNDPTLYVADIDTGTVTIATVGSGLTEVETPTGTRATDAGDTLVLGNNAGATATFDGPLAKLTLFATQRTPAQLGKAIARALDAPRHLDVGKTTLDWWYLDNADAFAALNELQHTEGPGAVIYEDGTGAIVFKSRHARVLDARSVAVQTTFRSAAGAAEPLISLPTDYDAGLRDVVNVCQIEVKTRAAQALQTVWALGATVVLAPGEVRSYIARGGSTQDVTTGQYIGPFTGAVTPSSGGGDFTVTVGSLASVTLDRTSGAEVTVTLTAGASGATVTGLRLRAQPVVVTATTTVRNRVDTAASQAQYGVQTYTLPVRAEIAVNVAQDFCDAVVGMYQLGRPRASFALRAGQDAARMTAALAREVNDRVRLVESNIPVDIEAYVTHVRHEVGAPSRHTTYIDVEEAGGGLGTPWIWDSSTWDSGDVWWY